MIFSLPSFRTAVSFSVTSGSKRCLNSSATSYNSIKVPITLIAELRKINPISLSKAREALLASDNSVERALEWLRKDLDVAGAKKAEKVGSRSTSQGLIGVTVMGTRAAMVELRCETDFVSRNSVFQTLVQDVTSTAAFLDNPDVEGITSNAGLTANDPLVAFTISDLQEAPLIPLDPARLTPDHTSSATDPQVQTVSQAVREAITQTGENIQLARAITFSSPLPSTMMSAMTSGSPHPFYLPGVYAHGATGSANEGTVAALSILSITSRKADHPILQRIGTEDTLGTELQKLARAVSRQIVGFPTKAISRPVSPADVTMQEEAPEYLHEQPFMMFNGDQRTVKEVLEVWGREKDLSVEVVAFKRWSVTEGDSCA
jgi:elongation factor Ts